MATTYNDIIKKRPGRAAYSIEEEKKDSGNHLFLMNNLTPCYEPFFARYEAMI